MSFAHQVSYPTVDNISEMAWAVFKVKLLSKESPKAIIENDYI